MKNHNHNDEVPKTEIRTCPECAGKAIVARGLKSKPCPRCVDGTIEVLTGTLLYPPVVQKVKPPTKKKSVKKKATIRVGAVKKKITVTKTRVRKAATTAQLLGSI